MDAKEKLEKALAGLEGFDAKGNDGEALEVTALRAVKLLEKGRDDALTDLGKANEAAAKAKADAEAEIEKLKADAAADRELRQRLLEEKVAELEKRDQALKAAGEEADEGAKREVELNRKLTDALEDLSKAQRAASDAGVAATAKPTKGPKSRKPRKIGAPAEDLDREILKDAMAKDEPFELVFSDGENEIVELDPLEVNRASFDAFSGRFRLREPVSLKSTNGELRVRGIALVQGGKGIAYQALPEAILLPVNQEVRLDKVIAF